MWAGGRVCCVCVCSGALCAYGAFRYLPGFPPCILATHSMGIPVVLRVHSGRDVSTMVDYPAPGSGLGVPIRRSSSYRTLDCCIWRLLNVPSRFAGRFAGCNQHADCSSWPLKGRCTAIRVCWRVSPSFLCHCFAALV